MDISLNVDWIYGFTYTISRDCLAYIEGKDSKS
jgi:hypothetical protein